MRLILLLMVLLPLSCSKYTQVMQPNGHVGYEFTCETATDCDNKAKELCNNSYKLKDLHKDSMYEYSSVIECTHNNTNW